MSPAGVADTRSSNADATSPHGPILADNTSSISHSQEVYRLEWFPVLVVMLLLSICEFFLCLLIVEAQHPDTLNVQLLLTMAGMACAGILFGVTVYIGFFIFLIEYHGPIGRLLGRFLFLPRRVQQMGLRVVAYSYGVLGITVLAAFLSEYFKIL